MAVIGTCVCVFDGVDIKAPRSGAHSSLLAEGSPILSLEGAWAPLCVISCACRCGSC